MRLTRLGLSRRGGFHPEPADQLPPLADGTVPGTVVMVGNVGQAFWNAVQAAPEAGGGNPIDRWTARVLSDLADGVAVPLRRAAAPSVPALGPARRSRPSRSRRSAS